MLDSLRQRFTTLVSQISNLDNEIGDTDISVVGSTITEAIGNLRNQATTSAGLYGRNSVYKNDFNLYTVPGTYSTSSDSTTASMSNSPTGTAGLLFVLKPLANTYSQIGTSTYILQIYITYIGSGIFSRMSSNNGASWTSWKSVTLQ